MTDLRRTSKVLFVRKIVKKSAFQSGFDSWLPVYQLTLTPTFAAIARS
ncbi:hypothetical protein [Pseudomonas sp. ZB1P45]